MCQVSKKRKRRCKMMNYFCGLLEENGDITPLTGVSRDIYTMQLLVLQQEGDFLVSLSTTGAAINK